MKSFVRSLAVGGCFVVTRFMGRLCGTPLIGASFAHLSLGAAVAPLAGFYGGTVGAVGAGLFTLIIATLIHGSLSLASLALYIPGIVGGLFFAAPLGVAPSGVNSSHTTSLGSIFSQKKSSGVKSWQETLSRFNAARVIESLFFIVCMILFWVNPVGQQAYLYPLLWLAPLVFVLINQQSLFARALVSAFAVHAVGACWWLYTMPMSAILWHGMMPLVVVERVSQALLMVVVVKVVEKVSGLAKNRQAVARLSIQ